MTQIEILPLHCKWKKSKVERRHPLMLNELNVRICNERDSRSLH